MTYSISIVPIEQLVTSLIKRKHIQVIKFSNLLSHNSRILKNYLKVRFEIRHVIGWYY